MKENPNLNPDRTNPSYDGKLDQRVAVLEVKIKAFLEKTLETKKKKHSLLGLVYYCINLSFEFKSGKVAFVSATYSICMQVGSHYHY